MSESMEENQTNKHKAKKSKYRKTKKKKKRQTNTIHTNTSPHLSHKEFLNSCCSNTAPEFSLVAALSPSIIVQHHHPKIKIAK
jgi:hypothetical protein